MEPLPTHDLTEYVASFAILWVSVLVGLAMLAGCAVALWNYLCWLKQLPLRCRVLPIQLNLMPAYGVLFLWFNEKLDLDIDESIGILTFLATVMNGMALAFGGVWGLVRLAPRYWRLRWHWKVLLVSIPTDLLYHWLRSNGG
jgi:hypothetical protein